jgi:hypothetical protein
LVYKSAPEAITPQVNAHIGGNQVIGLKSSVMAARSGVTRWLTD